MKWTLIAVGLIGTVTYAVIFFAQAQHERKDNAAIEIDVPDGIEVVERDVFDLPAAVSEPESVVIEAPPRWQGDAWAAGVEAFERGDHQLARDALEAAVHEHEHVAYRHYLLGLTYRRLGERELALSEFERSVELDPVQVRPLVNLARTYLDLEDSGSAREVIDQALEVDLEHADAWQVLGRIELHEGHFEEAAAAFAKATVRDPQHAWAWNNLGYARIQQENFAAAVEPLRRALATGREEAVFYNNLGVALERTGHTQLALTAFARAALLGNDRAETSYDRLETVLVARGETLPDFDLVESLDAVQMATLVAAIAIETALDEPLPLEEFGDEGLVIGRQ
jgi:Tfp pilus assembly protein PilF